MADVLEQDGHWPRFERSRATEFGCQEDDKKVELQRLRSPIELNWQLTQH